LIVNALSGKGAIQSTGQRDFIKENILACFGLQFMQIYIKDIEHFSRLRSVSRTAYPIRPRLINLSSLPMHKGEQVLDIFILLCLHA